MMTKTTALTLAAFVACTAMLDAQRRITSPDGHAATEIRGHYEGAEDPVYVGGKWIEISYGRPIKRGRDLWGSGPTYGKFLNHGAPVWRAGADISTFLMTDLPIVINGTTVPAGGHTMFVDLKSEKEWTLIVSDWQPQQRYNPGDKTKLWGSFGYTRDRDVVRAPMTVTKMPWVTEELTWEFLNMSDKGGLMALRWDDMMATVAFVVGE
ncbi:MAG: DUF2911 domain-containing protein [Vicinamibacterales bacterium]